MGVLPHHLGCCGKGDAGSHSNKETPGERGGGSGKASRQLSFSRFVELNLAFGYCACHGALTLNQWQQLTFYDFALTLTSKEKG